MARKSERLASLVGRRLRELREQEGFTQGDIEHLLDEKVKQSALSGYETRKYSPSLEVLEQLAKVLGVHPIALLLDPKRSRAHRASIRILECPAGSLDKVLLILERED